MVVVGGRKRLGGGDGTEVWTEGGSSERASERAAEGEGEEGEGEERESLRQVQIG